MKCDRSQIGNEGVTSKIYFILLYSLLSAVLITGGTVDGYTRLRSVELWRPGAQCSLPDMTEARSDHAQAGLLVCSGLTTAGEPVLGCERLEAGQWREAGAVGDRSASSMWEADTGEVFIMGGGQLYNSSLRIEGSNIEAGFNLRSLIV